MNIEEVLKEAKLQYSARESYRTGRVKFKRRVTEKDLQNRANRVKIEKLEERLAFEKQWSYLQ